VMVVISVACSTVIRGGCEYIINIRTGTRLIGMTIDEDRAGQGGGMCVVGSVCQNNTAI